MPNLTQPFPNQRKDAAAKMISNLSQSPPAEYDESHDQMNQEDIQKYFMNLNKSDIDDID